MSNTYCIQLRSDLPTDLFFRFAEELKSISEHTPAEL